VDHNYYTRLYFQIDKCRRMWVLDNGLVGGVQYCPPQLVVIDLNTDKIIHRYQFPESQYNQKSLLMTFVSEKCVQDLKFSDSNKLILDS
jgi:hypothetical protein